MIIENTTKILERYLRDIGWMEPITLGWNENTPVSPQVHQTLEVALFRTKTKNRTNLWIVWAGFAVTLSIFSLLIFSNVKDQIILGLVLFVFAIVILVVAVNILRKYWRESSLLDLSENALQNFAPNEAAEFINKMYWSLKRKAS